MGILIDQLEWFSAAADKDSPRADAFLHILPLTVPAGSAYNNQKSKL
jgi:hypothetical protein